MNVLSLFDGMSCGRIALDRLGIPVDKYYASEIDKYATQVSEANYPDIIRLGDVCGVKAEDLEPIDLLIAGSPCQGFSFAGKQLAFDDPRSALFFEFVRLLKECKPKYFLLENVRMKKEFLDIISEQVGCEPIFINSALVSAQNRQRFYWTNIPGIEQPEQRGIVLRDILETDASNEYLAGENLQKNYKGGNQLNPNYKSQANTIHNDEGKSGTICAGTHGYANGYVKDFDKNLDKMTNKDGKAHCLTARYTAAQPENSMQRKQRTMVPVISETHDTPKQVGTAVDINGHDVLKRVYSPDGKSPTVNTCQGGNREPKVIVDVRAMTEVRSPEANKIRYEHKRKTGKDWSPRHMRHLVERGDEKMNTLTGALTKQHILQIKKDSLVVQSYKEVRTEEAKRLRRESKQKTGKDHTPFRAKELVPREDGKVGTLTTGLNKDHTISLTKDSEREVYWRKLTPLECMRLQTVQDDYLMPVSNTQKYKMLGNGWTIEVIAHIFKNMQLAEAGAELSKTNIQQTLDL